MRDGAPPHRRRDRLRGGLALALVAPAAAWGCVREEPPSVSGPPVPEATEFEDPEGLLQAIEDGSFDERVGLEEQLAELVEPELPPVTRIDFVRGSEVPEDELPELRQLAARLQADPLLRVDLVGCSDPSGPEALNLRISRSRADAVARRLQGLGVAEEQLGRVVGRGEACEVQERVVRAEPRRAKGAGEAPGDA